MSDVATEPVDDFDDVSPDPHATPAQVALLDRAVAILDRVGDNDMTAEECVEWQAIIKGLHETTPGLYGSEWIHRNWQLTTHGNKMFSQRWTREYAAERSGFFSALLAGKFQNNRPLPTRRIPEGSPDLLK